MICPNCGNEKMLHRPEDEDYLEWWLCPDCFVDQDNDDVNVEFVERAVYKDLYTGKLLHFDDPASDELVEAL